MADVLSARSELHGPTPQLVARPADPPTGKAGINKLVYPPYLRPALSRLLSASRQLLGPAGHLRMPSRRPSRARCRDCRCPGTPSRRTRSTRCVGSSRRAVMHELRPRLTRHGELSSALRLIPCARPSWIQNEPTDPFPPLHSGSRLGMWTTLTKRSPWPMRPPTPRYLARTAVGRGLHSLAKAKLFQWRLYMLRVRLY